MSTAIARFFAAALLSSATTLAFAADSYQLNIPAQPLAKALQSFAQQSGLSLVHYSKLTESRLAPALEGTYTSDSALKKLLENTGLEYAYVNANTIEIRAVRPKQETDRRTSSAEERAGALRLARVASDPSLHAAQAASSDEREERTLVPNSKGKAGEEQIEEVIVTAQKRSERLIDVPQAVTVLSGDDLARSGVLQLRDFANTVPGMSVATIGAGFSTVTLRGVTTGYDRSRTAAIYVDEVAYGSTGTFASAGLMAFDAGLFDMERIEVLKGPQGTLYGASSIGGLLKYVTKRPDTESFGGEARAGVADTAQGGMGYNGSAAINVPIKQDKAGLRLSGFYSHDGGYVDNYVLGKKDVNRSNIDGGRADLLLTPNDALSVRINAFAQDIDRDGMGVAEYNFDGTPTAGRLDQRPLSTEPFEQRFRLASATVNYDFGPAALTSISSYQTTRSNFLIDYTLFYADLLDSLGRPVNSFGYLFGSDTDKFMQEVRLASRNGGRLEWLLGAYYTKEDSERRQAAVMVDLNGQPAVNDLYSIRYPSTYEEYAAFGNLTWRLTDKFDISGGLRYARNDQSLTQNGTGAWTISRPRRSSSEDVVTWLGNARYHFSDRATGYLRYATGYRPGGPNFLEFDPISGALVSPETFEADTLTSYEAGFKAETQDRRFGIDLAVYYIDWSNFQILNSTGTASYMANAPGGVTVRGLELALSTRPAEGFTVTGAFAFTDAYLSEADAQLGGRKGDRVIGVPRFTAALNADYAFPNQILQPTLGMTLSYISDRNAGFDGSVNWPQYRLPDYATVDLRAGLTIRSIDAQLYLRNLLDERGQISALIWRDVPAPAIIQPRTIGINLITRF